MRSERRSTAAAGRLAACSAKLKLVHDIIYNVDLKTRPVGSILQLAHGVAVGKSVGRYLAPTQHQHKK